MRKLRLRRVKSLDQEDDSALQPSGDSDLSAPNRVASYRGPPYLLFILLSGQELSKAAGAVELWKEPSLSQGLPGQEEGG